MFHRDLFEWEVGLVAKLIDSIQDDFISKSGPDCLIWSLESSYLFSSKSLFKAFVFPNSFFTPSSFPWKRIWSPIAPL